MTVRSDATLDMLRVIYVKFMQEYVKENGKWGFYLGALVKGSADLDITNWTLREPNGVAESCVRTDK